MTEIAIFPADLPQGDRPEAGDWHGLFTGLNITLGNLARKLPDPQHELREIARSVWSIRIDPTPIPLVSGAGVLDVPMLFSPSDGSYWDVHSISATGFTAGTVQGFINQPVGATGGALRAPFASAGVITFGKNHLPLRSTDRLVFVASGITLAAGSAQVLISLDATRVAEQYWGKYLL